MTSPARKLKKKKKKKRKKKKQARSEIQYVVFNSVTPFDEIMEWWNGGIFYNAECLVYATKVSQKWNCSEMRK